MSVSSAAGTCLTSSSIKLSRAEETSCLIFIFRSERTHLKTFLDVWLRHRQGNVVKWCVKMMCNKKTLEKLFKSSREKFQEFKTWNFPSLKIYVETDTPKNPPPSFTQLMNYSKANIRRFFIFIFRQAESLWEEREGKFYEIMSSISGIFENLSNLKSSHKKQTFSKGLLDGIH